MRGREVEDSSQGVLEHRLGTLSHAEQRGPPSFFGTRYTTRSMRMSAWYCGPKQQILQFFVQGEQRSWPQQPAGVSQNQRHVTLPAVPSPDYFTLMISIYH
jgi:hypothetical protein